MSCGSTFKADTIVSGNDFIEIEFDVGFVSGLDYLCECNNFNLLLVMEFPYSQTPRPRYTMTWLGLHTLFALLAACVLAIISLSIDSLSDSRLSSGLLLKSNASLVSDSTSYCFVITLLTLMSLMLVEIKFRKPVNYIQYGLVACALELFFLLLLSLSEPFKFIWAYIIVCAMTIGLLGWFVHGMMQTRKAVIMIVLILVVEYAAVLLLLYMGNMALLIGSLILFVVLALAMYFTLKLKIVDNELTLK